MTRLSKPTGAPSNFGKCGTDTNHFHCQVWEPKLEAIMINIWEITCATKTGDSVSASPKELRRHLSNLGTKQNWGKTKTANPITRAPSWLHHNWVIESSWTSSSNRGIQGPVCHTNHGWSSSHFATGSSINWFSSTWNIFPHAIERKQLWARFPTIHQFTTEMGYLWPSS